MENGSSLFSTVFGIPILVLVLLGWLAWAFADGYLLIRYAGPIKRGFLIWSEPLPKWTEQYLNGLSHDIVEGQNFIKINGKSILIRNRSQAMKTSWPYVAVVDLDTAAPRIEYRTSLANLTILIPFVLTILAIPFVVVVLVANHRRERKAILQFVHRHIGREKVSVPV